MKILFILDHYYPYIGGAEVLFKHLCEGLAKHADNFEITVITTRPVGTAKFEIINGVKIHRAGFSSRYLFALTAWIKALPIAKKADAIHTSSLISAIPAIITSWISKKPISITVHEAWGDFWDKIPGAIFTHKTLEKWLLERKFNNYACVSKNTAEALQKIINKPPHFINVIYPGIDHNLFNYAGYSPDWLKTKYDLSGKFVFLFFGRPGVTKGAENLVRAWREFCAINCVFAQNSRLFMLLSREPIKSYKRVQKLIKKYNLSTSIILHDSVNRHLLPYYISGCDCVVVPSISEGFGFSAVEAAAMGKPIIARKTGSLTEVLNGYDNVTFFGSDKELPKALKKAKNAQNIKPFIKFYIEEMVNKYAKTFRC